LECVAVRFACGNFSEDYRPTRVDPTTTVEYFNIIYFIIHFVFLHVFIYP